MANARQRYDEFKQSQTSLDLTRGKPAPKQLALSNGLLTALGADDFKATDGTDCRNYGGLDGIPEARALFGGILGAPADQVLVEESSSLSLMYETLVQALLQGVPDGSGPWRDQKPQFLCPSPGYDRHFAICEHLGIEMLPVDQTAPTFLDEIERLAASSPRVKGMWIVPRYNNPLGSTLDDAAVERLARMKTAAPDFRVLWDDAYAVHHLEEPGDALANPLSLAASAGHENRFIAFSSSSKMTFAGAGLAAMASSKANVDWMKKHLAFRTIGPDKINQLRHVRFLKDAAGIRALMQKHAEILRPKFAIVESVLREELGGAGGVSAGGAGGAGNHATWTKPRGGYFVSLFTPNGRANRVVQLSAEAGVKLTPAGSAFPYKKDPLDRHIRIAPSFPSETELERAMRVLAVSVQLAASE